MILVSLAIIIIIPIITYPLLLLCYYYHYHPWPCLGMALKASNVVGNPVTLHQIW
jgi:hypothetical protein